MGKKGSGTILFVVALLGVLWLLFRGKKPDGATFSQRPAGPGALATVSKWPTLAPGATVSVNVTQEQAGRYAAGAIDTAAEFMALPPAYAVEAALSSLNKECGSPGAPTPAGSNYVTPGSVFADAARAAIQLMSPAFNTPAIDGCGPKIDYLAKVITKTGRPGVWGINT